LDFPHKGRNFSIYGLPFGQRWLCVIYPTDDKFVATSRGVIISEPHATQPNGPFVFFDSEAAAIDYGKHYIVQDFLRDP
jgi:hypothetical protein